MCWERRRSRSGCCGDQRLELADDVAVVPEREVGLDPPFECGEAELLETRALVPGERLGELGQRRAAPERQRVAQQLASPARASPCESACRAPATERSKRDEVELVVAAPRAGSPAGVCAAAAPEAPSAAARRGSAPSSAPSPARPRPTARRRSGRGKPCGSRSGAGSRAAPAACPPRSAPARASREPRAGRGGGSPWRTLEATTAVPTVRLHPAFTAPLPAALPAANRAGVCLLRDRPARGRNDKEETNEHDRGDDPQRRRHRAAVRDARRDQGGPLAREVPVPGAEPLDRRRAQPHDDPRLLRRQPGGHLARRGVRDRRRRAGDPAGHATPGRTRPSTCCTRSPPA